MAICIYNFMEQCKKENEQNTTYETTTCKFCGNINRSPVISGIRYLCSYCKQ
jgi:hypothetical protein